MAVFGVDIFDSDGANETYYGILDLYDSGADSKTIEQEYPLKEWDENDDFSNELYITVCGLAYWEIGLLNEERLKFIKSIIDKGVSVKEWSQDSDIAGKERQEVLDKYWLHISQPNPKIRKRTKSKKNKDLLFAVDDLVVIKLKDETYRAFICMNIKKLRGKYHYYLVPTTYNSKATLTREALQDLEIFLIKIHNDDDAETLKKEFPGIEKIWNYDESCYGLLFGHKLIVLEHGRLYQYKERLEKAGTIKIIPGLKESAILNFVEDREDLEQILEKSDTNSKGKKFPLRLLYEVPGEL